MQTSVQSSMYVERVRALIRESIHVYLSSFGETEYYRGPLRLSYGRQAGHTTLLIQLSKDTDLALFDSRERLADAKKRGCKGRLMTSADVKAGKHKGLTPRVIWVDGPLEREAERDVAFLRRPMIQLGE